MGHHNGRLVLSINHSPLHLLLLYPDQRHHQSTVLCTRALTRAAITQTTERLNDCPLQYLYFCPIHRVTMRSHNADKDARRLRSKRAAKYEKDFWSYFTAETFCLNGTLFQKLHWRMVLRSVQIEFIHSAGAHKYIPLHHQRQLQAVPDCSLFSVWVSNEAEDDRNWLGSRIPPTASLSRHQQLGCASGSECSVGLSQQDLFAGLPCLYLTHDFFQQIAFIHSTPSSICHKF